MRIIHLRPFSNAPSDPRFYRNDSAIYEFFGDSNCDAWPQIFMGGEMTVVYTDGHGTRGCIKNVNLENEANEILSQTFLPVHPEW